MIFFMKFPESAGTVRTKVGDRSFILIGIFRRIPIEPCLASTKERVIALARPAYDATV